MWIMTTFGFFSIVEKPEDKNTEFLTVRARVMGDIVELCKRCGVPTNKIAEVVHADYRFRARIDRGVLRAVISLAIADIDYDNFKDEVKIKQNAARAMYYGRIWSVLYDLQEACLGGKKLKK